jgi:hypothetical protein
MSKTWTRFIAFLLIPCFLVDPTVAAAAWASPACPPLTSFNKAQQISQRSLFNQQALTGAVIRMRQFLLKPDAPAEEVRLYHALEVNSEPNGWGSIFGSLWPNVALLGLIGILRYLGYLEGAEAVVGLAMAALPAGSKLVLQARLERTIRVQNELREKNAPRVAAAEEQTKIAESEVASRQESLEKARRTHEELVSRHTRFEYKAKTASLNTMKIEFENRAAALQGPLETSEREMAEAQTAFQAAQAALEQARAHEQAVQTNDDLEAIAKRIRTMQRQLGDQSDTAPETPPTTATEVTPVTPTPAAPTAPPAGIDTSSQRQPRLVRRRTAIPAPTAAEPTTPAPATPVPAASGVTSTAKPVEDGPQESWPEDDIRYAIEDLLGKHWPVNFVTLAKGLRGALPQTLEAQFQREGLSLDSLVQQSRARIASFKEDVIRSIIELEQPGRMVTPADVAAHLELQALEPTLKRLGLVWTELQQQAFSKEDLMRAAETLVGQGRPVTVVGLQRLRNLSEEAIIAALDRMDVTVDELNVLAETRIAEFRKRLLDLMVEDRRHYRLTTYIETENRLGISQISVEVTRMGLNWDTLLKEARAIVAQGQGKSPGGFRRLSAFGDSLRQSFTAFGGARQAPAEPLPGPSELKPPSAPATPAVRSAPVKTPPEPKPFAPSRHAAPLSSEEQAEVHVHRASALLNQDLPEARHHILLATELLRPSRQDASAVRHRNIVSNTLDHAARQEVRKILQTQRDRVVRELRGEKRISFELSQAILGPMSEALYEELHNWLKEIVWEVLAKDHPQTLTGPIPAPEESASVQYKMYRVFYLPGTWMNEDVLFHPKGRDQLHPDVIRDLKVVFAAKATGKLNSMAHYHGKPPLSRFIVLKPDRRRRVLLHIVDNGSGPAVYFVAAGQQQDMYRDENFLRAMKESEDPHSAELQSRLRLLEGVQVKGEVIQTNGNHDPGSGKSRGQIVGLVIAVLAVASSAMALPVSERVVETSESNTAALAVILVLLPGILMAGFWERIFRKREVIPETTPQPDPAQQPPADPAPASQPQPDEAKDKPAQPDPQPQLRKTPRPAPPPPLRTPEENKRRRAEIRSRGSAPAGTEKSTKADVKPSDLKAQGPAVSQAIPAPKTIDPLVQYRQDLETLGLDPNRAAAYSTKEILYHFSLIARASEDQFLAWKRLMSMKIYGNDLRAQAHQSPKGGSIAPVIFLALMGAGLTLSMFWEGTPLKTQIIASFMLMGIVVRTEPRHPSRAQGWFARAA